VNLFFVSQYDATEYKPHAMLHEGQARYQNRNIYLHKHLGLNPAGIKCGKLVHVAWSRKNICGKLLTAREVKKNIYFLLVHVTWSRKKQLCEVTQRSWSKKRHLLFVGPCGME